MSKELILTRQVLEDTKDIPAMFELAPFKANYVGNYQKTTGKDDGSIQYERERLMFMKAVSENADFQKCTKVSLYTAFIELAASGSTLADGCAYIIPYGKVAQFQMGYKGRLEQINNIPGIELAPEPQIVWTGDDFDYELGNDPRILKHKPLKSTDHAKDAQIEYVYLVLTRSDKSKRLTIMDRATVLARRDKYSKTYNYWKSKGGEHVGVNVTKNAIGEYQGKTYNIKVPFWVTDEQKAFKKTVVIEAYTFLPKTARMKALDERIKHNVDPETGEILSTETIDTGLNSETIDQGSANVVDDVSQEQQASPASTTSTAPKTDLLGDLNKAF